MKRLLLYLFMFLGLLGGSCQNAHVRQKESISQTVYATGDSLKAGRIDLANAYSEQAMRLVAPPKQRLVVRPVLKTSNGISEKIVVLPSQFQNTKTVVSGSDEFNKLITENSELKKQFELERKEMGLLVASIDKTNRDLAIELEKSKAEKKGLFSWIWGLVGGLGIIGTIVLVIAFPAALPIITNIFGIVMGWFKSLIASISNLFKK